MKIKEKNHYYTIKRRSLLLNLLLSIFTLNIYGYIWFYRVLKDSVRIAGKKRNVFPLYYAMIALFAAAIAFSVASLIILSRDSMFFDWTTFSFILEVAKIDKITIATTLIIFAFLCALIGLILVYILLYKLAKNLNASAGYYITFAIFTGFLIPLLFAQDEINPYAGTYGEDKQPMYFSQPVCYKEQKREA